MKFKYNDRVKVTIGFYEWVEWVVVGYYSEHMGTFFGKKQGISNVYKFKGDDWVEFECCESALQLISENNGKEMKEGDV